MHLTEQARYLLPKCILLTSAMAFFQSAVEYGTIGIAAGVGIEKRLVGLGRTVGDCNEMAFGVD